MDLRYGYCLPDVDVGRILDSSFLPSSLFVFSFLLKWSFDLQDWSSFLEGDVVLSSTFTF